MRKTKEGEEVFFGLSLSRRGSVQHGCVLGHELQRRRESIEMGNCPVGWGLQAYFRVSSLADGGGERRNGTFSLRR